jgi:RNA polymerase sigma factor (sigma-70 family)
VVLRCQPDSRLAALIRGGYGEAFDEIARRYGPSLTSFAGSIVPSHRAEDVVQEALVKAYKSLPKSDPGLKLRPWLYTIVRNTALNDLRDERMHERVDENRDGVPQPPELIARRAELALLFERMKGLPSLQREALVKRELEGRSHEEIATALGATPGAVRALIFRARSALRNGTGLLIPIPVLRTLMDAGPVETASGGAGLGGAAATLTAGGSGGVALKAGAGLAALVLAVGSGVAIHDRGGSRGDGGARALADAGGGGTSGGPDRSHRGHQSGLLDRSNHGPGSESRGGRGSGADSGGDSSGPDAESGRAGPEGGGSGPSGDGAGESRELRGGGRGDGSDGGSAAKLSVSDSGDSSDGGHSGSGTTSVSSGTSGSGGDTSASGTSGSGGDGSSTDGSSSDSVGETSGSGSSGGGSTTELSSRD